MKIARERLSQLGLVTGVLLFGWQLGCAQQQKHTLDPETAERHDKFLKSIIWFGETNGLQVGLFPPDQQNTEVSIFVKSVGKNALGRWVKVTNEVPCKVEVLNEQGLIVSPTNSVATAAEHLPDIVRLEDYPKLPRRHTGQRYLQFYANDPSSVYDIELGKYYDFSKHGKFMVKIIPFLYDSEPVLSETNLVFSVESLGDLSSLVSKLLQPTNTVSSYLQSQLSAETLKALKSYKKTHSDSKPLQIAFVNDLNRIIQGQLIYDAECFRGIILRAEVQHLLAQNPSGINLLRLNKMLLEDAFPVEMWHPLGYLTQLPIITYELSLSLREPFQKLSQTNQSSAHP